MTRRERFYLLLASSRLPFARRIAGRLMMKLAWRVGETNPWEGARLIVAAMRIEGTLPAKEQR